MVWPFGSSSNDRAPTRPEQRPERQPTTWAASYDHAVNDPLGAAKDWVPVVLCSLAGIGALQLYKNYLRRIPGAAYVRPSFFRTRSIFGRVTSVGDGDGFHVFHTPGGRFTGWGWLRKVPEKRKELKDRTISIRIAGIDAPECSHFGRPAQPFSAEATEWLTNYILHRNVRTFVYRRDQYERIVGSVFVRRWLIRRNVGLEMVKRGLATIYEGKKGAEYGGLKEVYAKAEAEAKRKKLGMWGGKASEFESPKDYKARYAGQEKLEDK